MGVARLNLLRDGMDVAKAPLERAAGEDRIDPGSLVGPVGDRDRARDRVAAGEPRPSPFAHINRGDIVGVGVNVAHGVDEIGAGRAELGLGAGDLGLDHRVVGEPAGAARKFFSEPAR